ncbi:hypothetical protein Hanom_Chr07g00674311 [Helianthus anomalus]
MMHILDIKARETNKNEQEDSNTTPLSVLMMSVKNNTQVVKGAANNIFHVDATRTLRVWK